MKADSISTKNSHSIPTSGIEGIEGIEPIAPANHLAPLSCPH